MKSIFRKAIAMAVAASFTAGAWAQAQTLKVGSTPTGAPFTYLDTKTNKIEGLMVDVVSAIGKEVGFSVQIEPMQFSTLISSLTANRIDMISAAMLITPERLKVINFSNKVYTYGEGIVVAKSDAKEYVNWNDMQGKTIGVQVGTAYVEPLQKSGKFKEVKLYDTTSDLMRDANAGRIDVGMLDYPIAVHAVAQGSFPNLRVVKSYKAIMPNSIGIGARKGDTELMTKINAAIDKLSANGTMDALVKKWGL